jgi:hypothetical protein
MALINLKTNLKSLKFGNDQFDGGSSNQPYIQTPIPDELGEYGFLNKDFILRGGSRAVTDSLIDVKRLGKYFTDTKNPSGILFVAKQNLLSRTAVRTQTSGLINEGIYTPLSTLIEAGGVAFGLHVNKQGLNPFEETGAYATNNDNLYAVKIQEEKLDYINGAPDYIAQNRLYGLYATKIVDIDDATSPFYKKNSISINPNNILTYNGGPGSDIGIGNTNIRFADQRTGIHNFDAPIGTYTVNSSEGTAIIETDYSVFKKPLITINGNKLLGLSNQYLNLSSSQFSGFNIDGGIDTEFRDIGQLNSLDSVFSSSLNPSLTTKQGVYTYTQKDLNEIQDFVTTQENQILSGRSGTTTPGDFRQKLRINNNQEATQNIGNLANAPDYTEKNIENRVNLGDPGNRNGKDLTSYVNGAGGGKASSNSYDKINALPIYSSDGIGGIATFNDEKNDLVKFAITVLDTNQNITTNIHFRAFLNQISDAYTADWNPTRYIGRGENFYTYGGFDRKVSLSWTVAAQSKIELIPMYKKLNYLESVCAPNYSKSGYMAGNIVRLTVGGYLYNQPGIITGFSYEMNDDNATWEIGIPDNNDASPFYDSSVKELPHLIKVTGFNFIPIHEFVPRLAQSPEKNTKERFIALANGIGLDSTNYKA